MKWNDLQFAPEDENLKNVPRSSSAIKESRLIAVVREDVAFRVRLDGPDSLSPSIVMIFQRVQILRLAGVDELRQMRF